VTGRGHGRVRLFLVDHAGEGAGVRSWVVTVRPGLRAIRVSVTPRDAARQYSLDAKAVRNTMIGDDHGEIHVTALAPAPGFTHHGSGA
jgi:hypothetical protein